MQRVVITGMGIWSCLGTDLETVRESLYRGKSGIVLDPLRKEMGFRSGLTALLPQPDLKKELPGAVIKKGLSVRGSDVNHCDAEVRSWLQQNGLL